MGPTFSACVMPTNPCTSRRSRPTKLLRSRFSRKKRAIPVSNELSRFAFGLPDIAPAEGLGCGAVPGCGWRESDPPSVRGPNIWAEALVESKSHASSGIHARSSGA
jgi:hypothetical protein